MDNNKNFSNFHFSKIRDLGLEASCRCS